MLFCFSLISKAQNSASPASIEVFTTVLNQSSQLSVADLLLGTISNNKLTQEKCQVNIFNPNLKKSKQLL